MKLRRSVSPHQLLFALLAGLCLLISGAEGQAQDQVVFRDGRTQEGKILGVANHNVQIQVGAGRVGFPLAQITNIRMEAPPEVAAAQAAYTAGDYAKALAATKALVDKYNGLPLPWARQAGGLLGDLYVELGRNKEAEAAYTLFEKTYGGQGGSARSAVGMARIAVEGKDYAAAKERLEPVITAALKEKNVPRGMGDAYSWAFTVMGQVNEAENDDAAALENYLRTVTLFPQSEKAVSIAQARADALRQEKKVTVP